MAAGAPPSLVGLVAVDVDDVPERRCAAMARPCRGVRPRRPLGLIPEAELPLLPRKAPGLLEPLLLRQAPLLAPEPGLLASSSRRAWSSNA